MSKDNQSPHEIKASEIAGMTAGIQEKIAHEAAVEEVESRKTPSEEELFEETSGEEEEDKIVVEGEEDTEKDVDEEKKKKVPEKDKEVEEPEEISEEDENDIDFWKSRAQKFEKKFRVEKKFRKQSIGNLKDKLSSMERAVDTRIAPSIDASDDTDIFEAAGIEDPDETMTAKQAAKLMAITVQRQGRVTARETSQAQTKGALELRIEKSLVTARKEHEDFDEVVGPFDGMTTPKSPEFDREFTNYILSRKDPAGAMYDWAVGKLGESIESDDEDFEDKDRTEKALKRRQKKRDTLTMNRSGKGGSGKRPRKSGSTKKSDIFSRMTDGSEKEALALEEEFGGGE